MSLIHEASQELAQSSLDLFTVPPTQASRINSKYTPYYPVSTISPNGPIEFNVPASDEEYTSLADTELFVRAKIVKLHAENKIQDLDPDEPVGPVNLFLHSLFTQVDASLNDRVITPSTSTYAYESLIQTLVTYGSDAKKGQLTSTLFYPDTSGKFERMNPIEDNKTANLGLKARYEFTKESATVDMMGGIHCDIFHQPKDLLTGVKIRVKLKRSKPEFCLLSTKNDVKYRVLIEEAILYIKRRTVSSAVLLAHAKVLKDHNAKYALRQVECKIESISKNKMRCNPDNIFLGHVPRRIVIGMVAEAAFSGEYGKNPFYFQHFNATKVGVFVSGTPVGGRTMELDFPNNQYVEAYLFLFSGSGKLYRDEGNMIECTAFPKGNTLFLFDLTPFPGYENMNLVKHGNVRLEIQFAQALPESINVIIFSESDTILEIDRSRNIYDYAS